MLYNYLEVDSERVPNKINTNHHRDARRAYLKRVRRYEPWMEETSLLLHDVTREESERRLIKIKTCLDKV